MKYKQGLVQDYSQRIEGAPLIETKPNLNLTKAISLWVYKTCLAPPFDWKAVKIGKGGFFDDRGFWLTPSPLAIPVYTILNIYYDIQRLT